MARFPTLSLALALIATTAAAQTPPNAGATPPHATETPYWLHVTPYAGALVVSRPGSVGRVAAGLQLEVSHIRPMGMGFALGYWDQGDDDPDDPTSGSGPDGPSAEVLFSYRFHLLAGGRVSPYAGPVAGVIRDDPDGNPRLRWYFGGRGGVDIPTPPAWPAIRIEASYRHVSEADGLGAAESAVLSLGGRWSVPVEP